MDIIRVENLTVGYGREPVLRELSFALPAGEITAVIGKSGCGKSTLLKLITGECLQVYANPGIPTVCP